LSRAPALACEQFVANGIVNDANLDRVGRNAGDRHAEMRHSASEVRRAVDRIDDPCRAALAGETGLALLADEPIGRKYLEEAPRDERLRLPIHFGQIVLRALEANRE
jgi:hypothetical protein